MEQFVVTTLGRKPLWWGHAQSPQAAARAALLHPLDRSVDPPDWVLVYFAGSADLNKPQALRMVITREHLCLGKFDFWKADTPPLRHHS